MDSFELEMTLGQFGFEFPERCKTCSRLGELAAKLSTAQGNKDFLATSTDTEVIAANTRSQLTEQLRERYPAATDEQVAATVERSVSSYLGSENHTSFLQQAGVLMEQADSVIDTTVTEIDELLIVCPPEGCGAN